jgi:hypothetical protein
MRRTSCMRCFWGSCGVWFGCSSGRHLDFASGYCL